MGWLLQHGSLMVDINMASKAIAWWRHVHIFLAINSDFILIYVLWFSYSFCLIAILFNQRNKAQKW